MKANTIKGAFLNDGLFYKFLFDDSDTDIADITGSVFSELRKCIVRFGRFSKCIIKYLLIYCQLKIIAACNLAYLFGIFYCIFRNKSIIELNSQNIQKRIFFFELIKRVRRILPPESA